MFSIDPDGMLLEANDRWYQITDQPRDVVYPMSWLQPFSEDCQELIKRGWEVLTVEKLPWSAELKLEKNQYDSVRGEEVESWILAAASPEFNDGIFKSVMGSITDISYQKRFGKDAETRARLSEQLLLRTQEAKVNENNFKRFSDLSPGGLVIMDPSGDIEYANSQWHKISGLQLGSSKAGPLSWISAILEDDQHYFSEKWHQLITEKKTLTIEVRMKTEWEGDIGGTIVKTQRWILASLYPEEENGALRSVMGCKSLHISPYHLCHRQ
jgi:PAS domain-containing protein